MAIATYLRTIDVGAEPERKAVSIVDVDGQEVQVSWWPSLLEQWGKDGVRAYLEAEALWTTGNYADARAKLQGLDPLPEWAQRWIDEHPDPLPVAPDVDPLL